MVLTHIVRDKFYKAIHSAAEEKHHNQEVYYEQQLKEAIIAHRDGETDVLPAMNANAGEPKSFSARGAGTNKGLLHDGRLEPNNQIILLDGRPYEPGIIPGIDSTMLSTYPSIFYDYTIHVYGGCPKGEWSNVLHFTDESGGAPYSLRIIKSAKNHHTVNYHSPTGAIVKIEWDI